MRGAGLVGWDSETIYAYFTITGGVTRVRVSLDEVYRLDVAEGLRVRVEWPGREPADGLVVRVRHEPPFAWIELTPLTPTVTNRAG